MQGKPFVPIVLQAWRPETVNGLGFPGPGADPPAARPQVRGQFGRCHEDLAGAPLDTRHFFFYLLFQILCSQSLYLE